MHRSILNKMKEDILWVDADGKISFCNKHLLNKLHYASLEGVAFNALVDLGNNTSDLEPMEGKKVFFIDEAGKHLQAEVDIMADSEEDKPFYWILVKRWHNDNYTKEELEQILDLMPYSIWIQDYKGKYRYTNRITLDEVKAVWKKEMTKEDFYDRNMTTMWGELITPLSEADDNEILAKGEMINEERFTILNGRKYSYHMTKVPLFDENGQIRSSICIMNSQIISKQIEEDLIVDYLNATQPTMVEAYTGEKYKNECRDSLQDVPYLNGPTMMAICKYQPKTGTIKVQGSIGADKALLKEVESLSIDGKTYEKLLNKELSWKDNLLEGLINKQIPQCQLIKQKIRVMHCPIQYNKECLGILLIGYPDKAIDQYGDKMVIENMSRNVAIIMNNIKLGKRVNKELMLRLRTEQQIEDIVDITFGLYAELDLKTLCWKQIRGWSELLGWDKKELSVAKGERFIYVEDKEEVLQKVHDILQHEKGGEMVSRFYCKDGQYKWIRWKGKLNSDGDLVIYGIDISKEIEILEQRKSYQRALELETDKTEFFADVSHEFKTPLNIIYGIIQLVELDMKELGEKKVDLIEAEKLFKYNGIMKQNILRLLRLINNIVDISKMGSGAYQVNLHNCDVIAAVEDITLSVAAYTKDKDVHIIFDTELEELNMACDVEKIERIMLNLLSNAVKYSNGTGNILVYMKQEDDHLVIQVTDNGVGIPEDKLDSIFRRFVKLNQSFTRKNEGSGIGLSLVKGLVEMMEGTITVTSKVNEGTCFTVKLPIKQMPLEDEEHKKCMSTANSRIEKCNIEFADIYSCVS